MKNKCFKVAKLLTIIVLVFTVIGISGGGILSDSISFNVSHTTPSSLALQVYAYSVSDQVQASFPPSAFENIEQPPTPSTCPDQAAETPETTAVTLIPKTDKIAYLTFDDGPCEVGKTHNTIAILDLLAEYDIKATFFVLGAHAKKYPDIILRQFNEGHEIGNHTYSHVDPAKTTDEKLIRKVKTTNSIIKKITGKKPTIFRAPYGCPLTKSKIKGIGMRRLGWDLDTLDWRGISAEKIVEKVEKVCKKGIRILFHGSHSQGLKEVIDLLLSNGYCFDTLKNYQLKK